MNVAVITFVALALLYFFGPSLIRAILYSVDRWTDVIEEIQSRWREIKPHDFVTLIAAEDVSIGSPVAINAEGKVVEDRRSASEPLGWAMTLPVEDGDGNKKIEVWINARRKTIL